MDKECTRSHLQEISLLEFDWKLVGRRLLDSNQLITDIDHDEKNEQNKRERMLMLWQSQKGSMATYKVLVDIFQELNNNRLAEDLSKKYNTEDNAQPARVIQVSKIPGQDNAQPARVIQVSKIPGQSHVTHRCGCNNCDLMKLITEGCPNFQNTDSFPFLETEGLSEGEVKSLRAILQDEGREMSKKYDNITKEFRLTMEKKVQLSSFKTALESISGFDSFKSDFCALQCQKKKIRSAKTHSKLVDIIENYTTWFDCTLLKRIVEECVEKEDYDSFCICFKKYEEERRSYCRRGIFECPSYLFSKNKLQPNTRLFCLLVSDDKIQNFEQLDLFEGRLCSLFGISRFNLMLCSIGKGCIELIYLLPSCVHEALFPLNKEQLDGLATIGVTAICIGTSYESINTLQKIEDGTLNLKTSNKNNGHHDIKQKLADCQKDFESLKSSCNSLIEASVEQLTRCVAQVPKKPHYQQYILECSGNLRQCSTRDEFFAVLCSSYSNYLFYQLFERIVETYGNTKLMSDMEKYKDKLTSITAIAKVEELNDGRACTMNTIADCEVVIAVQIPFSECRISSIEAVRDEMRRISYMFEFCHTLCEISGDSNTTTTKWLISNVYSRHLQVDLLLSTIPLRKSFCTNKDAPHQLLMAYDVIKICIDGQCVFEYDPSCEEMVHLRRSILKQNITTNSAESQPDHLTKPDDLSFKPSNITHVLQFSTDQWHEFALLLGLTLQEIADCWSAQTVHCNYPNTLLKRWLSTDDSASWYTLMTVAKAMLPPACDYADTIVQNHPYIVETNEAELKDLQETIPFTLRLPSNAVEGSIEMEQMDVDGAVENVAKAVDERFKAIEEVLRASNDELKEKSNSEEYWKKQVQLDNDLMYALSKQNDEIERLLQKTDKLCSDLCSRNEELLQLMKQVAEECQKIDQLNNKVHSKKTIFEELNDQLIRLQRLKSQNAERLAALVNIPSKVYQLQQDANKNRQLCIEAKENIYIMSERQDVLLKRIISELGQNEDRLNHVNAAMAEMLEKWKDHFSQAASAALLGAAAGIGAAALVTFLTWGMGAPIVFGAASAAGVGAAIIAGKYGWDLYEQTGHKNLNTFREYARENNAKRVRLTEMADKINKKFLIHSY